jgi:hypothetical protein
VRGEVINVLFAIERLVSVRCAIHSFTRKSSRSRC